MSQHEQQPRPATASAGAYTATASAVESGADLPGEWSVAVTIMRTPGGHVTSYYAAQGYESAAGAAADAPAIAARAAREQHEWEQREPIIAAHYQRASAR